MEASLEHVSDLAGVTPATAAGITADRLLVLEQDLVRRQVPSDLIEEFFEPLRRLSPSLPGPVWLAMATDTYNLPRRADARRDAGNDAAFGL